MTMCDAGAINLAVKIVEQAVIDYRFAQRMCRTDPEARQGFRHNSTSNDPVSAISPREQLEKIERFFRGRWFHTLVDLDGEELLRLLQTTPQGKRIKKTNGVKRPNGTGWVSGSPAKPIRKMGPGRPIDWEKIKQWPDVKARLEAGGYTRAQVAQAMGLKDASSVVKLMDFGTAKTRRRLLEALEVLEREEVGGFIQVGGMR